jgi:hypothetical protein
MSKNAQAEHKVKTGFQTLLRRSRFSRKPQRTRKLFFEENPQRAQKGCKDMKKSRYVPSILRDFF